MKNDLIFYGIEIESREKCVSKNICDIKRWIERWDEDTDGEFAVLVYVYDGGLKTTDNVKIKDCRCPTEDEAKYINNNTGYIVWEE